KEDRISLRQQPPALPGDQLRVARTCAHQVDLANSAAHSLTYQPVARRTKVRTPTPEGPLARWGFASSSQAVPAMSRCTQGVPSANSLRNVAAVIAPPQRPPMLGRSAKALLR